jgi:hypothetical protein
MNMISRSARTVALAVLAGASLHACAEGPRIQARPQAIAFSPGPSPDVNEASATVSAAASSGLPVSYASLTPSVCSVDAATGVVTATRSGTCTIAANQPGDAIWQAARPVTRDVPFTFGAALVFAPAPALALYDLATVSAVERSGLDVAYASATPSVCSVEASTGLVSALGAGDCTVVASAGTEVASQTIAISQPSGATVPTAPSGVAATAGHPAATATVRVGGIQAGGSPVIRWTVSSSPPGVTGTATTLPATVTCPSSCAGYRFTVSAANEVGDGPPSGPADLVTRYRVVATFHEPDTQPNDSVFVGTFSLNASAGAVTGLHGRLGESMTGGATPYPRDTMTWVTLGHQLDATPVELDGAAGWLVTAFRLDGTATLTTDPRYDGVDGWMPGKGMGLYYGYPGANPGNSYARIFVNAADPTAPPTQSQLDQLAYADCSPGGMMGASCMTGTSVAAHGTTGTMGGYPLSQVTTRE